MSRNTNASKIGDANDPYGGIGRNGAQKTPEVVNGILGSVGSTYQFQTGKLYNLNSDTLITGHSDIAKKELDMWTRHCESRWRWFYQGPKELPAERYH